MRLSCSPKLNSDQLTFSKRVLKSVLSCLTDGCELEDWRTVFEFSLVAETFLPLARLVLRHNQPLIKLSVGLEAKNWPLSLVIKLSMCEAKFIPTHIYLPNMVLKYTQGQIYHPIHVCLLRSLFM